MRSQYETICHRFKICSAYLGSGNSPNLVVVRTHEHVGNASTHHTDNPLVEVLRLGVGNAALKSGVDEAVNALHLVLLGQNGNVVLEGIRDPDTLVADIGDTLVGVPVIILRKSFVDAVVEVLVVGEDNVSANIVQLGRVRLAGSLPRQRVVDETYKALGSNISTGKTTSLIRRVDNEP